MESKRTFLARAAGAITGKHYFNPTQGAQAVSSSGSEVRFKVFDTFLNYLFGGNQSAEAFVKSYRTSPLVYVIVNKIATTAAAIDRVVKDANGEIIELKNSKIWEVLKEPKRGQSYIEFNEMVNESLLLAGNAFIYLVEAVGVAGAFELEVWKPQRVTINTNTAGFITDYEYRSPNGATLKVSDLDKVLHIKTSNLAQDATTSEAWGLSPLEALFVVVKGSDEKFNASASIFKNRGIIGILTSKGDVPMLPKERDRLQGEFDSEIGGSDKFNSIKISRTDLGYIQTGMSPTDLKLLEGIIGDLRLLASAYGVPSVIFNDVEQSTYNNMLEAKKSAYTDAYLPLDKKVDSKISAWLSFHLKTEEFLVTDLTSIEELRDTTNKLMRSLNSVESRVAARILETATIDEVRESFGGDPIEGGLEMLGTGAKEKTNTEENG